MRTARLRETTTRRKRLLFPALALVILFASGLAPSCLTSTAAAAQITLQWDQNPEPDVIGYRVYYGTASGVYSSTFDVGNWTSCIVSGLQAGVTYFFTATAYDAEGNESDFSTEIAYTVGAAPAGPGAAPADSAGGGCFIATAAYGSYMSPEVMVLRAFRDRYLLTSAPGRVFVETYYRLSPAAADFIRQNETMRALSRWALTPLVYGIKYPETFMFLSIVGVFAVVLAGIARLRRRAGSRGKPAAASPPPDSA